MDITEQLQYVISQIKQIRVQKGVSQIELSVRSNLSQSFLANLEKGKKQPSVLTVIRIADALEVSVQDFFPEIAEPESKERVKKKIISLLDSL
ncbi:MAG: helix-turn-helix transcriptional regulator [Treponema sp.]|jgi:transcriptional regulator with XRE-family HTH domain|nr:helix-turn-helix transcriptional regulator [Treponema sp.]